MKYYAEFTSMDEKDYRIQFETPNGGNTERRLKLSGSPLVTSVEGGETLYEPIRCGGATVGLLTESWEPDLYSGQATGVKVTVTALADGRVAWVGYVSPTMYNQNYDAELEELQIDCVDGIAVLKNIPYRSGTREQKTLLELIRHCLRQSGVYRNLYVSDCVQLKSETARMGVCDILRVSEQCFFEDKDDPGQDDDEVAWSCYDVLEEVMRFLGYTLISEGDSVYCIDYDGIKRGANGYLRYSLESNGAGEEASVSFSHHIQGSSNGETGTQISLDTVYNKVTVADSFRSMDSLFPSFGDPAFEQNITAESDPWLEGSPKTTPMGYECSYFFCDTFTQTLPDGKKDSFQIFLAKAWYKWYIIIVKFYRSDIFRFHRYKGEGKEKADYTDQFEKEACWGNMLNSYGAAYVKMYKKSTNLDEVWEMITKYRLEGDTTTKEGRLEIWKKALNGINPQNVKLEPAIIFYNPKKGHIGPSAVARTGNYKAVSGQISAMGSDLEDCQNYPCMTLRDSLPSGVFGGSNIYMTLKCKYQQHDRREAPWALDSSNDPGDGEDYKLEDELFFWGMMKWGDRWLDENGEWIASPRYFKLWLRRNRGDIRVSNYYAKDFTVADNSAAAFITAADAVYIAPPTDGNVSGNPSLTLYMNRDMRGRSKREHWDGDTTNGIGGDLYTRYYNEVQVLQDFDIQFKTVGGMLDDSELLTDTVYTNVIENGSVDEMDEIEFRICTFDDKNQSYSTVDYLHNGVSEYVDRTYHKALHAAEGGPMRQEEHCVFRNVTQYESPRLILEYCLKNSIAPRLYGLYTYSQMSGRQFVMTGMKTDWRRETCSVKLIEKA